MDERRQKWLQHQQQQQLVKQKQSLQPQLQLTPRSRVQNMPQQLSPPLRNINNNNNNNHGNGNSPRPYLGDGAVQPQFRQPRLQTSPALQRQNVTSRRSPPVSPPVAKQRSPQPQRLSGMLRDLEQTMDEQHQHHHLQKPRQVAANAERDPALFQPSMSPRGRSNRAASPALTGTETYEQLLKSHADLTRQVRALNEDTRLALEQKDASHQQERQRLDDALNDLKADNEALKRQLKHTSLEQGRLFEQRQDGDEDQEAAQIRVAFLTEQVDQLTSERQDLQKMQDDLLARQAELLADKADLAESVEKLHEELQVKSAQISELNGMVVLLRRDVEDLTDAAHPNLPALREEWEAECATRLTAEITERQQRELEPKLRRDAETRANEEMESRLGQERVTMRSQLEVELTEALTAQLTESLRAQLELEYQLKKESVDELRLQLNKLEQSLKDANSELEAVKQENQQLDSSIRETMQTEYEEKQAGAVEAAVAPLQQEIDRLSGAVNSLEEAKSQLEADVERGKSATARANDMEFQVLNLETERDELAERLAIVEQESSIALQSEQDRLAEIQRERDDLAATVTESRGKEKELLERCKQLSMELAAIRDSLTETETDRDELARQLEALQHEEQSESLVESGQLKDLRDRVVELEAERDILVQKVESVKQDSVSVERDITESSSDLQRLADMDLEIRSLREQNSVLEAKIAAMTANSPRPSPSTELAAADADLAEKRNTVEALQAKNCELESEVAALTEKHKELEQLQSRNNLLEIQIGTLTEKCAEVESLRAQNVTLGEEIMKLSETASSQAEELRAYHATDSTRAAETVEYLNSQHRQEIESLTTRNSALQRELDEMSAVLQENQTLNKRVGEFEFTTSSMQEHIEEKERIFFQFKQQFQQRLTSAESALKERAALIQSLTNENERLLNGSSQGQAESAQNSSVLLNRPFSAPDTRRHSFNDGHDEEPAQLEINALRQQIKQLACERDEMSNAQHSLLERQLEQVSERERLEAEIDLLNSKVNALSATSSLSADESRPSRGWLTFRRTSSSNDSSTTKNNSVEVDRRELERQRKHLQKSIAHQARLETEWKARVAELQKNLNAAVLELDTSKQQTSQLLVDNQVLVQQTEAKFKQRLEEAEQALREKENELRHMKKWHYHYGKARRLFRTNTQPTVKEETADELDEYEANDSHFHRRASLPDGSRPPKMRPRSNSMPHVLQHGQQNFGGELSDIANGNSDYSQLKLPSDVATLQSHVHKLLLTVAHLRQAILRAQEEIEEHRSEAQSLRDDLTHVHTVLEQDRASAYRSIHDWEQWASDVQEQHAHVLTMRDTQITALKTELESAKIEWNQVVKTREETIVKLLGSRKALAQEMFEECAVRLNRMQRVMENAMEEERDTTAQLTAGLVTENGGGFEV